MIEWAPEAPIGTPYWWTDSPQTELVNGLPDRCDVLVIGAGYTGLSAARVASDGGASVCVLDAGDPGKGASTRNGGMFGAHPRFAWDKLEQMFGRDVADGVFSEASAALDWVKNLIVSEGIDCDLTQTGRIQLAWTRKHAVAQKELAAKIKETSDVAVDVVSRDGLSQEITSEKYFGGLLFSDHCAIHPAKFHAGLLNAVLKRDVAVIGNTPVTGLERVGTGFQAKTPAGDIQAEKVILATNGYTPDLFRWHQARVFPLPSFIIATEELPSNLIGHLAPGRRMMVETRARHSYYRISPDGKRILWGGRSSMVPKDPKKSAQLLADTMTEVWPELEGVKISHSWTGFTGFSFNQMPQVGMHEGVHFAMGYTGSGTVMAPYLGGKAAYQALGDERGKTAYSNTALKPSWLHPFSKPHFLHAANFWYRNWVDRVEGWQAR